MASYAAVSDLISRKRVTTLNDLATDDGARTGRVELATNPVLIAALADASGAVDSALLVGKLYTAEQLEGLTGNALAHLKRITCDIAFCYLLERNPIDPDEAERYRKLATGHIERLQSGENVFGLAANIGAGLPTITGPTTVDYSRMNLIPDRTRNYYPNRAGRLPTDRG